MPDPINLTLAAKQIPERNCYGAVHSSMCLSVFTAAMFDENFLGTAERYVKECLNMNIPLLFIRYNGQLVFIRRKFNA